MQAFLGEAARRRQSRRSSTPSKGTSGPSAISATTSSHQRTKSSSSGRLFHSSSRPSKRNSVVKQPSNKSLASEQASPPDSSHDDSTGEKKNFDVFAFMEHDDEAGSTAIEEEVDGNDESTQLQRPLAPPAAGSHIPHDAPEHHSPVGYSDLEVHATAQDKDYEHHDGQLDWVAEPARSDTFHSDSGISVHSSSNSSGNDSPLLSQKLRSRPDTANSVTSVPKLYLGADTFPFRDHHSRRASAARLRRLPAATSQNQELYGKCPESYYGPSSNNTIPGIETQSVHSFSSAKVQDLPQVSSDCSSPPHQQHIFDSVEMPSPPPSQSKPTSSSSAKTSPSYASFPTTNRKSSSGYSLLASSISTWNPSSDAVLRPIYRKFETLNNRILLYLQDEICEMEQDLQELDEAIATEEERMLKGGLPSHPGVGLGKASRKRRRESRRQECKFPSQLQWARQELMGRLMGKVSQYNRALSSYSTLTQSLHPASTEDITFYQKWISTHAPIADQESAFIHHNPKDLSTVPPRQSASSPYTSAPHDSSTDLFPQQVTPAVVATFTLLTSIIVFKFVPQVFARLVIALVTGFASYCTMPPATRNRLWEGRGRSGWRRAIGGYATVMIALALVVD